MAGEATFTLSEADLIATGRDRLRRWLLRPKPIIGHLVVLAMIFGLGYTVIEPCDCVGAKWHVRDGLISTGAVAVWLVLYYLVYYYATVPWRARKTLRDHAAAWSPFTVTWSDESFGQSSLHGTATYRWEDLTHWNRLASAFLIYYARRPCFIVPCRALTDEQVSDLDATMRHASLPCR